MKFFCLVASVFWVPATVFSEADPASVTVQQGWVTVKLPEYQGAINNPLKGFRSYKENGYGLLERVYIKWSDIEQGEGDSVERIIAHTNKITRAKGKGFEELNVKLIPRVYLDWDGGRGGQHWPSDLHTFDYDSPAFQLRLNALVAKLGKAWDEDPRIFAVQMGLIGYWGEHHSPAPTVAQRRLLADAFSQAFKHKPVLVRHHDPEFVEAGFGVYYDTFANIGREPPEGPKDQFPWQASQVHRDLWKRAPMEGEVEYNWQKDRKDARPEATFGRTPDETMTNGAYRRFMIDKIRRYHTSYLGWIDDYDASKMEVLEGAGEIQKAFGYRMVLDEVTYPVSVEPGAKLSVRLVSRNTGSAPFYLDWPVGVGLLDPVTAELVWSAPMKGVDIRKWLPGEDWNSDAFAYSKVAPINRDTGEAVVPNELKKGNYILALSILDRQGGMLPSARFATSQYFRGGWHPVGVIGLGSKPEDPTLKHAKFDSPAFDDSLHYKVDDSLKAIKAPPPARVRAVEPWVPNPKKELINPWRAWSLNRGSGGLEKEILADGHRVIRVVGEFGQGASLSYYFGKGIKLDRGRYRIEFKVRGTPGQKVQLDLADDWRSVAKLMDVSLTKDWTTHQLEFGIDTGFKDKTTLSFKLPREGSGTFDLGPTHLRALK